MKILKSLSGIDVPWGFDAIDVVDTKTAPSSVTATRAEFMARDLIADVFEEGVDADPLHAFRELLRGRCGKPAITR